MSKFYSNPDDGLNAAFSALHPNATDQDFYDWQSENLALEGDVRLPMYGPANLCAAALDHPKLQGDQAMTKESHGAIMFALGHFQTLIDVFTALQAYERKHGFGGS